MEIERDICQGEGKTFELYDTMLGDEKKIASIVKALKNMKPLPNDFRVIDIAEYKQDEAGIKFFQTVREREINALHLYCIEFGEDIFVDGVLQRRMYMKKGSKEEMLKCFEDICIKRISPSKEGWKDITKEVLAYMIHT